jgi:hypothetical protein
MKIAGNERIERPENHSGNENSQPWTERYKESTFIRIADADYRNSAQPAELL